MPGNGGSRWGQQPSHVVRSTRLGDNGDCACEHLEAAEARCDAVKSRVTATKEAAAFIREHGGRLYVWADNSGLEHTGTSPPAGLTFIQLETPDGIEFFQHDGIETPDLWTLGLHHFPRRHVIANWGGWRPTIPLMP